MRPNRSIFLLVLLTGLTILLPAQEEEAPIETDWTGALPSVYTRGDQTFNISLGVVIPLAFVHESKGVVENKMGIGGMGMLGYNYFLGPHLFVGGELSGMFAGTEGLNNFFMVPFGARAGYQFLINRFEFPFSVLFGFVPQSRLGGSYFGPFIKPSGSAFFRFNPDWSFGVTTSFSWVPQWTKTDDIHGFFLDVNIGLRYHF
jgi:hypothetical protein